MSKLTHINDNGDAQMVDVGNKAITSRVARATGTILMRKETLQQVKNNTSKKGDVLAVARIAGIMAGKKTAELIPLCHALNLSKISVDFEWLENGVRVNTLAKLDGKTGVEMEALTACSIALLTIYDMCKAADKGMIISQVKLLEKSGGKSGHWQASE